MCLASQTPLAPRCRRSLSLAAACVFAAAAAIGRPWRPLHPNAPPRRKRPTRREWHTQQARSVFLSWCFCVRFLIRVFGDLAPILACAFARCSALWSLYATCKHGKDTAGSKDGNVRVCVMSAGHVCAPDWRRCCRWRAWCSGTVASRAAHRVLLCMRRDTDMESKTTDRTGSGKAVASLPWIEKYRPNSLDDLIAHDHIIGTSACDAVAHAPIHRLPCRAPLA